MIGTPEELGRECEALIDWLEARGLTAEEGCAVMGQVIAALLVHQPRRLQELGRMLLKVRRQMAETGPARKH